MQRVWSEWNEFSKYFLGCPLLALMVGGRTQHEQRGAGVLRGATKNK
jgi:hypothetical protein